MLDSAPRALALRLPNVASNGQDGRALLQTRTALWARFWSLLIAAFLVVGQLVGMRQRLLLPDEKGDLLLVGQIAALLASVGVWLRTRRGERSERELRFFEAAGTLAPIGLVMYVLFSAPPHFRPETLVLLAYTHATMARAVIIPSTARRTLIIGLIAAIPIVVATHAYYVAAAVPELPPPGLYAVFTCAWSGATLAVSTVASRIIFGLREKVRGVLELGQYRLEEKLGEGGMGVVYRASHLLLRRPTAVKLLQPDRALPNDLLRFEREVQVTSLLTHPNTVAIYDYGRTPDGIFYYAMEFLDGVDLQELVDVQGAQPPAAVVHILEQVCGALDEAHTVKLIHRDIKPANIILCERGKIPGFVKVVDFGLVKSIQPATDEPGLSQIDAILGTPLYLSPESIARPAEVDHRSDLYALGAVAYFLLTGKEVFRGNSVIEVCGHHLHSAPVPPSRHLGTALPSDLEELVLACLEKDPARRPQSAAELADRLRALACRAEWTPEFARRWWQRIREALPAGRPRKRGDRPASPTHTLAIDWQTRTQAR